MIQGSSMEEMVEVFLQNTPFALFGDKFRTLHGGKMYLIRGDCFVGIGERIGILQVGCWGVKRAPWV
jgi:hypothetical protein